MLKNAPTLAIVAVHTEENEPSRVLIPNITNIYIHYLEPSHAGFPLAQVDARLRGHRRQHAQPQRERPRPADLSEILGQGLEALNPN